MANEEHFTPPEAANAAGAAAEMNQPATNEAAKGESTAERFVRGMELVRAAVQPLLTERMNHRTELTNEDLERIAVDQHRYDQLFEALRLPDGRWQPEIAAIIDRLEEADFRGRTDPEGIRLFYAQLDRLRAIDDLKSGRDLQERQAARAEIEGKLFPYITETVALFAQPGEETGPLERLLQTELTAIADRFMARAQDETADNRYHWLGHTVYQVVTDTASHLRFLARQVAHSRPTQLAVEDPAAPDSVRTVTVQTPTAAEAFAILLGALYHDIGYLPESAGSTGNQKLDSGAKRRRGHEAAGGAVVRARLLDPALALPEGANRVYLAALAEAGALATSFGDNRTQEFVAAFSRLPDGLRGLVEVPAIADLHGQIFDLNLLFRLPYLHEEMEIEDPANHKGDKVVGRDTVGMFNGLFEKAVTTGQAPFPFPQTYAKQLKILIEEGYRELAERYQIIDDFTNAAKGSPDDPSLIAKLLGQAG